MDRWERIEAAYHGARALGGEDRSQFLAERCGSDPGMRRQIEILLAQDGAPNSLLGNSLDESGFQPASDPNAGHLTDSRFGAYEVGEQLGSGGMGDVYRARDTKLDRSVALKVLPVSFALDTERLTRFEREARMLAALNHPNIAAIYGFEQADGMSALVLEFVDGPTLADRIARGPIPVDDALAIARQIADALAAAHERGIIHRDLKPANISLRSDGTVKVLDFGLAKALDPAESTAGGSPSALVSPAMTVAGVLMGTAAYMSPEQARGEPADRRSDVWGFGCVLYEMLTGVRAFAGDGVSDTLAAVLRGEPDWHALPGSLPPLIRVLVEGCLRKDRKDRIGDASSVRFLLNERAPAPPAPSSGRRWRYAGVIGAAAIVAALGGFIAGTMNSRSKPVEPVARFAIPLEADQQFTGRGRQFLAISRDGSQVVFVASQRLYRRVLSEGDVRPIPGTEGFGEVTSPAFSPDGGAVAFWAYADQSLKTIPVSGGTALTICRTENPFGLTWDASGLVYGERPKGIARVSPQPGSAPEILVQRIAGQVMYGPEILPRGRGILFSIMPASALPGLNNDTTGSERWDKAQIVVQTSAGAQPTLLLKGGSDARYLPSGHIVYVVGGRLFAFRFDLDRMRRTTDPVPVLDGVLRGNAVGSQFSVSDTGSLVYASGPVIPGAGTRREFDLALLDRTGRVKPLNLTPGPYESPRFSPDGRQVAFGTNDDNGADIYVYDLSGATSMVRLTHQGRNRFPIWSSDGRQIAFQSDRQGDLAIYRQPADNSGPPERLTRPEAGAAHVPESWHPREDLFSFSVEKGLRFSLWLFSIADRKATPFDNVESGLPPSSVFSPDGKWIAYQSGEGVPLEPFKRSAVFARPFPSRPGEPSQVAGPVAYRPMWSPQTNELFYTTGLGANVDWKVVRVTTQPGFSVGLPMTAESGGLEPTHQGQGLSLRNYDIGPDGRRIGVVDVTLQGQAPPTGPPREIRVVLNWLTQLEQRLPAK